MILTRLVPGPRGDRFLSDFNLLAQSVDQMLNGSHAQIPGENINCQGAIFD